MLGQALSQLQKALNAKADSIQREFIAVSERLNALPGKIAEADDDDKPPLLAEQDELRERRADIAEAINVWRDRAKDLLNKSDDDALRTYLQDISDQTKDDEQVQAAIKHAQFILNATDEELAALAQPEEEAKPLTPAGRLIERARKEYDLRGDDPAPRHKAAVEFANRPYMLQDMEAIAEIEESIYDPDKFVREVVLLTLIQLHRFRALRLADLNAAYTSVERLTHINHPQAIPALVSILEHTRTGYVQKEGSGEPVEESNSRLRVAALKRLIEWHTSEAKRAVEAYQLDRDQQVSYLARRALETFPNEWTKPIRGTGIVR
ncbi:MAG TPA: hypothetical protein VJ020_04120 [Anaerolineales bacterium]|nr:hypothetical protein [Anaerolineales bacterium]